MVLHIVLWWKYDFVNAETISVISGTPNPSFVPFVYMSVLFYILLLDMLS